MSDTKPKLVYSKKEGWHKPIYAICPNCGQGLVNGGHYVPPSFGEEGFFTCKPTALLDVDKLMRVIRRAEEEPDVLGSPTTDIQYCDEL